VELSTCDLCGPPDPGHAYNGGPRTHAMRVAPQVALSPEERAALERWAREAPASPKGQRARVILAAARGLTNLEIARRTRVHRLTVARWRTAFLASRMAGVQGEPRRLPEVGRLSPDTVRAIVSTGDAAGLFRGDPVSGRQLARQLGVSHTTVRRVWQAQGVRPRRVASAPFRPDPPAPWKAVDVLAVRMDPPSFAFAFRLGRSVPSRLAGVVPVGSDSPLGPIWGDGPSPPVLPGEPSGRRPSPGETQRASDQMLRLLERVRLRSAVPTGSVGAIVRLSSSAESDRWSRWTSRHPEVLLERVPSFEAWRNRVTRRLTEVAAEAETAGERTMSTEIARSIARSIASFEPGHGAFEWVASASDTRRGSAARRLRHDLAVTGHSGFGDRRTSPPHAGRFVGPDPRARSMARNVLRRSLGVGRGDRVTIDCWTSTLEYANALVLETLRLGAQPLLVYQDEPTYWSSTVEVRPEFLTRLGGHRKAALERSDALVSFVGPSDRERFHALPHATMLKLSDARDDLYRAAARAGVRAVEMAMGRASPASAAMYGVDLDRWRNELVEAALVDPRELHRLGIRLAARLRRGREVRLTHPNGTDLRLGLRGVSPIVSDGIVPPASRAPSWQFVTLPAGVVNVALEEGSADGVYRSNVTSSIGLMDSVGELAGGEWTFRNGRLIRYAFARGREAFDQSYGRAGPGREVPGTLSIGLNAKTEIAPLLEDQGRGMVGLVLGRNDHVGGSNHVPWWGWLFLREATVTVDDRPIVRSGSIVA